MWTAIDLNLQGMHTVARRPVAVVRRRRDDCAGREKPAVVKACSAWAINQARRCQPSPRTMSGLHGGRRTTAADASNGNDQHGDAEAGAGLGDQARGGDRWHRASGAPSAQVSGRLRMALPSATTLWITPRPAPTRALRYGRRHRVQEHRRVDPRRAGRRPRPLGNGPGARARRGSAPNRTIDRQKARARRAGRPIAGRQQGVDSAARHGEAKTSGTHCAAGRQISRAEWSAERRIFAGRPPGGCGLASNMGQV